MIVNATHRKKIHKQQLGFSVVELLIVIGILGGLVGLSGAFQAGVFKMNRMFGGGIEISFEGNRMIKDFIRLTRPIAQSAQGAFPIETAATSTFVFFTDIDNDGVTERVRYFLASTTLKKGVTKASGSPSSYVTTNEVVVDMLRFVRNDASTPVFSYFDRNYSGTSTPLSYPIITSAIRHVRLHLILDESVGEPPAPVTMVTGVTFRNLKDNQ